MNPEEFFRSLQVPFLTSGHHHTRLGWIQFRDCPGCGSSNYHLGFNTAGKYFVCWKCGSKRAVDVLRAFGARKEHFEEFFQDLKKTPFRPSARPSGKLKEPKHRGPLKRAHREYLESRNFDPDLLKNLWDLEGIGLSSKLAWRIYIPILYQGVRVSWTTRAIGPNVAQRYVSASAEEESLPHKDCIYGIDYACHSIVIVEGPADVWRVGPGAAGLFGTAYTASQIHLLSRFPFRYILFDNATAAQAQARNLADQLSCFPGETTILECDAKDPGELPPKEVCRLRKWAQLP